MAHPERVDRYEIQSVLGTGAMGSVYRAWDPKLHREVALKLVSDDLSCATKGRERFHREARAIAALRHPNIVEIYDYSGVDSEHLYLVMEKLEGDDLFNVVNERGPMPEPVAAAIGHELCLALGVAHEAGVIHRDLKPENVFLNAKGRVILTDFGVVKAVREDSAVSGFDSKTEIIGTPGFMAPELMMSRELGPPTDIFALGALLYNITTGQMPFDGHGPMEIYRTITAGKYDDPRRFNTLLSDEFATLLSATLEPKAKRRYQAVEAVREDLKSVLEGNGVSDLRDDLRDYMRNPSSYGLAARRRTARYILERLKISVKDHDHEKVAQLHARLLEIDPDNQEVDNITGVLSMDDRRHSSVRRSSSREYGSGRSYGSGPTETYGRERPGNYLYIIAGALALCAVVLAGFLVLSPKATPNRSQGSTETSQDQQPSPRPRQQSPATKSGPTALPKAPPRAATGSVQVRVVRGGAGILYVDGRRIAKVRGRNLVLSVGRHVIEMRGRGKRVRKAINVRSSGLVVLWVDLKRGRINLR